MDEEGRPWWTGSVGYELDIRAFSDSSGNGVGDLCGIVDQLDHDLPWANPAETSRSSIEIPAESGVMLTAP